MEGVKFVSRDRVLINVNSVYSQRMTGSLTLHAIRGLFFERGHSAVGSHAHISEHARRGEGSGNCWDVEF